MKQRSRKTWGFTLVELLIVIAIIGLLSTIVLARLSTAKVKARDARRLEDVRAILTALELYRADHGHYPCHVGQDSVNDSNFLQILQTNKYISQIPKDPLNTAPIYEYSYQTWKTSPTGQCGQIAEVDYNREIEVRGACAFNGVDATYDRYGDQSNTLGHCHIFSQPLPPPCVNQYNENGDPDAGCVAFGQISNCCSQFEDHASSNEY